MKRPYEPTPPLKKPEIIPLLEYSILSIQFPKLASEFDGFFIGTVNIHSCPARPSLINCSLRMKNEALVSLNSAFIYTAKNVHVESDQLVVKEPSFIKGLTESMTARQVKEVIAKMTTLQGLPNDLSQIAQLLIVPHLPPTIPSVVVSHQLPSCDLNRMPLIHVLYTYLVSNKYDDKQRKRLMDLPLVALHELKRLLSTEPWKLVFGMYKLKGLSEDMLNRAVREFALQFQFPLHIQLAVKMYYKVMRLRLEESHTVFNKSMLNLLIPCMHVEQRRVMEEQVFGYLEEKAFFFLPGEAGQKEKTLLATKFDHYDATASLTCLKRIQSKSLHAEPLLRGRLVPQLFPKLTARQTQIAQYITHHWLTIVEGMPGTGKTALITWCVSHYQNVMLVSFVGMMAKSLQKRNGRRKEVAHTIHYILAQNKHGGDAAKAWLKEFQVLIIDEFSNVSMPLFRKLLQCLPNINKVVLVGDHRQLKPIEGGDPMGDLISIFGSQMLHDNLRVVPELKPLQFAPALIAANNAAALDFSTPCLTFMDRNVAALYPIFLAKAKELNILMNLHIVALVNMGPDGRDYLNKEVQSLWIKLKVLHPQGSIQMRHNLNLFPGCKITFTQNYNKPIEKTAQHDFVSDPVANGELCIVQSIVKHGEGYILKTVDSLDKADEPECKMIWIHEKTGVSPKHVDYGYVTTVFKSQGNTAVPPPEGRGGRGGIVKNLILPFANAVIGKGREFPYVIFWTLPFPKEQWTRASAYVAISRGKRQVFIAASSKTDFLTICSQPDPKRKTIFKVLMEQDAQFRQTCNEPVKYKVSPLEKELEQMGREPCVPVLSDFVKQQVPD